MLEWKEIKGYDKRKDYKWQDNVELPEIGEIILIIRAENELPFVGYFNAIESGEVYIFETINNWEYGVVKDGIKWARFNRA